MSIEVIIPAYKPDKNIYKLIDRLRNQQLKPCRIRIMLTVDNENYLDSEEYTEFCKDVGEDILIETVPKSEFSHGGTRQRAAEESEADFILFMTQDAVPYDDELTTVLREAFEDNDCAVAFGRQLPHGDAGEVEKFSRLFNYPSKSYTRTASDIDKYGIKAFFSSDVCAMYRRDFFNEVGGFDTEADFNEDSIFAYNALLHGYKVAYCSEARVIHSHNLTLKQQFDRNRMIAGSHRQHPDIFLSVKSESEGMKYLRTGLKYMISRGEYISAAELVINCVARYAGYLIGKYID